MRKRIKVRATKKSRELERLFPRAVQEARAMNLDPTKLRREQLEQTERLLEARMLRIICASRC